MVLPSNAVYTEYIVSSSLCFIMYTFKIIKKSTDSKAHKIRFT